MSSRMYDSYCSLTCKMILAVLRTLALHQTLFCIAENVPLLFSTGYPEQERDVIARNTLCTVFCAYFSALGILGNAPDTLRNTFLGYMASDSLITLRKPQFNTWENWLHHGMTGLLLSYTAWDSTRDYELFQLAGVGEISTFFLCFADTFRNVPRLRKRFPVWNEWSRVAFALSFFVVRVGWWSHVLLVQTQPPPYAAVAAAYYGILGLQYYWGGLLLRQLKKLI